MPLLLLRNGDATRRHGTLFERTHLSDKSPSAPCCGPSRGLHCSGPMESTSFGSSRPARMTAGKQQGAGRDACPSSAVTCPPSAVACYGGRATENRQRWSRCGLEKIAMPRYLTGIANQHNPTLRIGLYSPVKIT
jgi:hypothetical protein